MESDIMRYLQVITEAMRMCEFSGEKCADPEERRATYYVSKP
jgi:hypothetical protein